MVILKACVFSEKSTMKVQVILKMMAREVIVTNHTTSLDSSYRFFWSVEHDLVFGSNSVLT